MVQHAANGGGTGGAHVAQGHAWVRSGTRCDGWDLHRHRPDQRVLKSADGQLESRPLTPAGVLPGVEVYELKLAPRAVHTSEPHAPGTAESVTVLVGSLRIRVAEEVHELAAGDAASFAADVPHSYENPGRTHSLVHNVIVYQR